MSSKEGSYSWTTDVENMFLLFKEIVFPLNIYWNEFLSCSVFTENISLLFNIILGSTYFIIT